MSLPYPTTAAGNRIYAPTSLPKGSSCLEVLSSYWNQKGTPTYGQFWVWDHCSQGNYAYIRSLSDSTWTSKYVRSSPNGVPRYYAGVFEAANDLWYAILWDFTTAQWETIFTQSGTNPYSHVVDGWTMHETYYEPGVTCPVTNKTVYSWEPQILSRSTGTWQSLSDYNTSRLISYDDCAENGTYFHRTYVPGTRDINYWEASNYR